MSSRTRQRRLVQLSSTSRPRVNAAIAGVSGNTPLFQTMVTGEYLKTLDHHAGMVVFDQMRRSDPQVIAVLKSISLPLRSNDYQIEPASKDVKDVEISKIIDERLKSGMSITWDDTLRHALLMLPFGFSVLEKVWERDADGFVMPKKLDPRLPTSIIRWQLAADRSLVGPIQVDTTGEQYLLPIEKILVFTTDREGDNWEGTSILRPAYKPWYLKDTLEKINAVKHDRFGAGVPRAKTPAGVTPQQQTWKDVETLLERFQANEQGYLMQPEGWDVDILGVSSQGGGTDALPSIKYYDEAIAKAMLAMFINLGTSATGSRALGKSFFDAFMLSLQAFANYIAEVFNRFLIPEWCDFNWETPNGYPKMKAAQISDLDYTQIAQLVTSKAIVPDIGLENSLRRSMNLPERDEASVDEPESAPGGLPDEGETDAPPVDEGQDEGKTKGATDVPALDQNMREPTADTPEMFVDVQGVTLRLNEADTSLMNQVRKMRDDQARVVANQLAGGRAVQNVNVPMKKEMYDAMVASFDSQLKAGRKDVLSEASKQRPGSTIKLADPLKKKKTAAQQVTLGKERLSLDVEGAASKLKSTMAQWAIDEKRAGTQSPQLADSLMTRYQDLPWSTWDRMVSGAVNSGWGAGRLDGIEQLGDQVERCYYSDMLDAQECENCRLTARAPGADDHEVDDPDFATPNPECLGGGLCRCMTIAVLKAESATSLRERRFGGPGSGRYPAGSGGEKSKSKDLASKLAGAKEFPSKIAGTHNFESDELFSESSALTDVQKEAISVYRSNDYMSINAGLRGEVPLEGVQGVNEAIAEMDKAFENAPTLREPALLYRGGNFENKMVESMVPGAVIEDKAFLSTSDNPHVASSFAGGDPNMKTQGVQFEILAPTGSRYLVLSPAEEGSESEVLFGRNSRLHVLSRGTQYADGTGDTVIRAQLETKGAE